MGFGATANPARIRLRESDRGAVVQILVVGHSMLLKKWQLNHEGCTLIDAWTRGLDRAAVQFGKVLGYREADAEAPRLPGWRGILLPETIEHMGQEVGRDPATGIFHENPDVVIGP